MSKVPEIIPVSDLRQDTAAVLKRVQAAQQPLVITQRGRAAAIMLSVEAYERLAHNQDLLSFLARGDREIAGGAGYDLDDSWPRPTTCSLRARRERSLYPHWTTTVPGSAGLHSARLPQRQYGFDNERRTCCAVLSSFPLQVGKSRSSHNLPIEKSLSHRIDFSIVSRTKRYGLSPSDMARSYLDNPVHDGAAQVGIVEIEGVAGDELHLVYTDSHPHSSHDV